MTYNVKLNQIKEASSFYVLGDRVSLRAKLDGSRLNVVEVIVEPGSGTPLHTHASVEIIHVLSGTVQMLRLADGKSEKIIAAAGDIITIPSGIPHAYSNESAEQARFTALLEDDMLSFLEAVASDEPLQGPPSQAAIADLIAIGQKHGVHFLAP
jgi:quercetin dioxygenase-like cupin family protein